MNGTLETVFDALELAWRQRNAVYSAIEMGKNLLTFKVPFEKIFATFIAILQCLGCVVSDTPLTPMGDELDLTGYELVLFDDFDGNSLNEANWQNRYTGKSGAGFYSPDMISVTNGNLILSGKYLENGYYGPGWYGGAIESVNSYRGGYFEVRAILSKNLKGTGDFWSSFWITAPNVYDHDISKGGPGGCEIDIFESFSGRFKREKDKNCVTFAVWCNGHDSDPDNVDGRNLGTYYVPDPFTNYNTYGLKWTDKEYIWYINGVEAVRTSYPDGVSRVPEFVVLSQSIPVNEIVRDKNSVADFKIDYVKIYQTSTDFVTAP